MMKNQCRKIFASLFLLGAVFLLTANVGWAKGDLQTCEKCHEDTVANFKNSFHSKAWATNPDLTEKACSTCHGETEKHIASEGETPVTIRYRGKEIDNEKASDTCLKCHNKTGDLAFWASGKHVKNGVNCGSCHSPHNPKESIKPGPEKCFTCHKDVRHDVEKISHHPIIEGKVSCSDCHNPHGSLNKGMLVTETTNQLCYKCHTDKRGPFIWEHPVVEENCLACHEQHGSRNPKLLVEKTPNLCNNCHLGPHGTPYDATSGFTGGFSGTMKIMMVGRGCLNCHSKIHGSNASSNSGGLSNNDKAQSGKFFLR